METYPENHAAIQGKYPYKFLRDNICEFYDHILVDICKKNSDLKAAA